MRTFGLATGMAGAIIILVSRNAGALDTDASFGWYLAALVTPAALAAGNVYRSTHWPKKLRSSDAAGIGCFWMSLSASTSAKGALCW